ncbi:MAG: class I SAM-dependent methyltransferase [Chloroflexi bacterium]|nr:class I SAM-dependent methyltransferase [Chloroflexota bacterium]
MSYDAKYFQAQLDKSDEKVAFQYGRLLQHIAHVAPDARILDAGCGAGPALRYLKQRGFAPFGSDFIEYPLVQARQLIPDARLVQCNSDNVLPYADNSFDVILMSEVIEHVASPEFTLRECYRVLRGGGAVAVTTPNLWDVRRTYYPLLGKVWAGDADATHQTLFNPQTLHQVFARAGFRNVRVRAGFKPLRWVSSRKLNFRTALPGLPVIGNTLVGVGYK